MLREFKVEANVGKPQVAYRETITKQVEAEGKYVRQTGGKGQYGHCWVRLIPQPPGTGYLFENETVGGTIPKEFIKPIDKGIEEAMEGGILAGYPMVDMKVEVVTPDDYMGDVIGDLNSRRGKIQGMEQKHGAQVIESLVPLAEMFGYATDLRSKTQGRATYTMHFGHYAQVPNAIAETIVSKAKGAAAAK